MSSNLTNQLINKLYATKVPEMANHRERLAFGIAIQSCVEIVRTHIDEDLTPKGGELSSQKNILKLREALQRVADTYDGFCDIGFVHEALASSEYQDNK